MYSDFIEYKLAGGVTEDVLKEAAADILASWMSKQPGFLSWQINSLGDGAYLDVVQWESKEAAKAAEATMGEIPKDHTWFTCYDAPTITSKNGTELYHS